MPIRVECQCGKAFAAPENLVGKTVKCPQCHEPLRIHAAPPKPAAAKPAAQSGGLADLLDEAGITHHTGPRCPQCDAPMAMQAVVCLQCGFNRQTGAKTASDVRTGPREVGHGEAASALMARAAAEVAAAPVHTDDKDMGGVKSVWTWIFVLFLPILFGIGFAAAILWGSTLGAPFALMYAAIMADKYVLIIPALIMMAGLLLWAFGWLAVTSTALEQNVWHGLLCMIFLGTYCYFWGMANWRTARSQMQTFLAGIWVLNFGMVTLYICVFIETGLYWWILPTVVLAAGNFIAYLGILMVTLTAFEERLLHGMLSMLVPLYAPIYGFMRWNHCKKDMILFLSGFGTMILGIGIFVIVALMTDAKTMPSPEKFMRDAAERAQAQVRPHDLPEYGGRVARGASQAG